MATEERGHLVERQPDRFLLEADIHPDLTIRGLVDDDFAAGRVGTGRHREGSERRRLRVWSRRSIAWAPGGAGRLSRLVSGHRGGGKITGAVPAQRDSLVRGPHEAAVSLEFPRPGRAAGPR